MSNFGSTCQLILFDNARIYYIMEEKKFSYSLLGLACLLILVGLLIQPRREKAHEKTKKQRKYPYFKGQNLPKG